MPMATSPLPWFPHPRGLYQMTAPEELSKQADKMAMTSVLAHPMSTVSPPTSQACMPVRFLKMERQEIEDHHHAHYSPILRLPTSEEHRDAKRTPNNTPPTTTNEDDSVPLDFSSRSAPCSEARTMTPPDAPNCMSDEVVDLCTRGTLDERYRHHAAEEEERHNTSRGSSTDSNSVFNVSSEVPYPYATHHRQHHQAGDPPSVVQQQYPIQPVALHPHQHHQHFMMAASAAPRHQTSPHRGATEGSAAPSPPVGHQNFPGILSLTPPPPVPLHAPLQAPVTHPLSPPQQPPFPPLLSGPLHQTLAAAASGGKADSGSKITRPFKAYPKDPLTLTVGVSTAESLLGQASNEAYVEFRKQMLRQVAATKARRPVQTSQGTGEEEASPSSASAQECPEFQQQNQSSASSGDEEGSSGGSGKKRVRTNSESNGPYSVVKDAAYWERRRKNNEAAKRSRDARRAKEDEIAIRAAFLEQENLKLKYEVAALRHETSNLRCLLYSAASSS